MDYSDIRKIKSTIRQMKSKIQSLSTTLQQAPTNSLSISHRYSSITLKPIKPIDAINRIKVSSPARKHILTLKDHFNDQLDRIINSTTTTDFPSLAHLCCFTIGKLAIEFNTDVNTTDSIDISNDQDDFYDYIPPHFRSIVLFEHLVQTLIHGISDIIKKNYTLSHLILSFADTCIQHKATYQAFEILQWYWYQSRNHKQDLKMITQRIKTIGKTNQWIQFIAQVWIERTGYLKLLDDLISDSMKFQFINVVFEYWNTNTITQLDKLELCFVWLLQHSTLHGHFKERECSCGKLWIWVSQLWVTHPVTISSHLVGALYMFLGSFDGLSIQTKTEFLQLAIPFHSYVFDYLQYNYVHIKQLETLLSFSTQSQTDQFTLVLLVAIINHSRTLALEDGDEIVDWDRVDSLEMELTDLQSKLDTYEWVYDPTERMWMNQQDTLLENTNSTQLLPPMTNVNTATSFQTPKRKNGSDDMFQVPESDPLTAADTVERVKRIFNEKFSKRYRMDDFVQSSPVKAFILKSSNDRMSIFDTSEIDERDDDGLLADDVDDFEIDSLELIDGDHSFRANQTDRYSYSAGDKVSKVAVASNQDLLDGESISSYLYGNELGRDQDMQTNDPCSDQLESNDGIDSDDSASTITISHTNAHQKHININQPTPQQVKPHSKSIARQINVRSNILVVIPKLTKTTCIDDLLGKDTPVKKRLKSFKGCSSPPSSCLSEVSQCDLLKG
ncbi:hypothetical protein BC833DRAFT_617282 [Globomyces pollinis-pini]|nr:hypothetical protein BC833DRAFT_617282 [Globomyces pollinis-pini]